MDTRDREMKGYSQESLLSTCRLQLMDKTWFLNGSVPETGKTRSRYPNRTLTLIEQSP